MMINCFCGVWPWGDSRPVAKTNMPALQVLKPGKKMQFSECHISSSVGEDWCLRLKCKIMSRPLQRNIQYKHKSTRSNAKKSPTKKKHFQVRSRKICSRVKYSKTAQCNYSQCLDSLKNPLKKSEVDYATLSLCPDGLWDVLF